jgi:hypothetical protein
MTRSLNALEGIENLSVAFRVEKLFLKNVLRHSTSEIKEAFPFPIRLSMVAFSKTKAGLMIISSLPNS